MDATAAEPSTATADVVATEAATAELVATGDAVRASSFPIAGEPREWRVVVLHHSATPRGSVEAFHRHHRDVNGWNGVGYHFVIGNGEGMPDGAIAATYRWAQQQPGAHAGVRAFNDRGIGVCLVGDFRSQRPTAAQLASLDALTAHLRDRCQLAESRLIPHGRLKGTTCPGPLFPADRLLPATAAVPKLASPLDELDWRLGDAAASCDDVVRFATSPAGDSPLFESPSTPRMDPQ